MAKTAHPHRIPPDRQAPPRALVRQPAEHARRCSTSTTPTTSSPTGTRSRAHWADPGDVRAFTEEMVLDWCRRRPRSRDLHDLPAVRRARGRRADAVLRDGHADAVARARAELQGAARADHRQGPRQRRASSSTRCCRPPTSPSCSPTRCRWARTSCRTSSSRARSCAASTTRTATTSSSRKAHHRQGGRARAGHRRPQDVEELRQRDLHLATPPRRSARRSCRCMTDPARKLKTDPGDPDICPLHQVHKLIGDAERDRRVGRVLPRRRVRLRRAQEQARRRPRRLPRAVPGAPSRARGDPGLRRGGAGRRRRQGRARHRARSSRTCRELVGIDARTELSAGIERRDATATTPSRRRCRRASRTSTRGLHSQDRRLRGAVRPAAAPRVAAEARRQRDLDLRGRRPVPRAHRPHDRPRPRRRERLPAAWRRRCSRSRPRRCCPRKRPTSATSSTTCRPKRRATSSSRGCSRTSSSRTPPASSPRAWRPRTACIRARPGSSSEFLGLMPDYLEGLTLRGLAVICADLMHRREVFLLEAEHVASMPISLELHAESVRRQLVSRGSAALLRAGRRRCHPGDRRGDVPGDPRAVQARPSRRVAGRACSATSWSRTSTTKRPRAAAWPIGRTTSS